MHAYVAKGKPLAEDVRPREMMKGELVVAYFDCARSAGELRLEHRPQLACHGRARLAASMSMLAMR